MKQSNIYYVILVGAFLWCVLLFLPPVVASISSSTGLIKGLYSVYSKICHQYDSHSLHIFGHKLGVCARCGCIYFGFFFGVMLASFGFLQKYFSTRTWLLLAVLPMVIDVGLDLTGVHSSSLTMRIVTGAWFGIVAGQLLTPVIVHGFSELYHKHFNNSRNMYESQT